MTSQITNIHLQTLWHPFCRERERERVIFTSYKFFIINIFKPGIRQLADFRAFRCGTTKRWDVYPVGFLVSNRVWWKVVLQLRTYPVKSFLFIILFFIFFLTGSNGVYSQSISPEVYPSSGDYYTGTNATLSWTIGESVTKTFSAANTILTQGFQQSQYSITSIEETTNNNYQISVYPNPATDLININVYPVKSLLFNGVQSVDKTSLKVELIDLQGKRLYYQNIPIAIGNSNNNTLDLKQFPGSIYFLKIYTNDNKLLKSYKITKL